MGGYYPVQVWENTIAGIIMYVIICIITHTTERCSIVVVQHRKQRRKSSIIIPKKVLVTTNCAEHHFYILWYTSGASKMPYDSSTQLILRIIELNMSRAKKRVIATE